MHRQSKLQRYYKVVLSPHRLVIMLTPTIMIALYILCLIAIAFGEINENGADNSNEQNITTLYPVKNLPFYFKELKVQGNVTKIEEESNDEQTDIATSKHNKYTHSDPDKEYKTINTDKPIVLSSNDSKISDVTKYRRSKEDNVKAIRLKEGTTWRIDATYAPSKVIEVNDESQSRDVETEDKVKAFKPSPHLGSFYDEIPTPVTAGFTPYKPSFGSFEKDFYKLSYKGPVDSYQTPIDPPYRFENAPRTADWHSDTRFEARPMMEPSEKIPAGGLYKLPDAFQEKPSSDGNNPNFGLEFKGQKDNSVKQSGNPWKSFLHMVTALVPVGLIVSALTPHVITLENTGNNNPYSRVSRRSDQVSSSLPPQSSSPQASSPPRISERCKRRLLCELHADQNYISNLSFSQRKPCYKLRCEDPYAMNAVLRWLLDTRPAPGYRPGDHDRRGYIVAN